MIVFTIFRNIRFPGNIFCKNIYVKSWVGGVTSFCVRYKKNRILSIYVLIPILAICEILAKKNERRKQEDFNNIIYKWSL